MIRSVLLIGCTLIFLTSPLRGDAEEAEAQKAVLITGASSGFGRLATERLADKGYFVYAGARKQADIDELNALDNVTAVRLDVTVQDEVDAALALIESEGRGLWGLVNNAGVNTIEPLIEAPQRNFDFIFDVNVGGVVRVTRAFAPLIIESKGRIVNISSIGGILSGGMDGYGIYVMSKHALEAYSDQLEWELARFGVAVAAIEPGSFATQIGVSRCRLMLKDQATRTYRYYQDVMDRYLDYCRQRFETEVPATPGASPEPVAAAIEHALFATSPKSHYLVASDGSEAMITIGKLFEEIAHLNLDHEHSIGREELIRMLDLEIARARGEKPPGMPGIEQ